VQPRVRALDQAEARDQSGLDGRSKQFGLQERTRLHDRPSRCMTMAPRCKYIMLQKDCQRGRWDQEPELGSGARGR
jgi:hypothetical protein